MVETFTLSAFENFKILFVAILMYVLIYALLKHIQIFGDDKKISSLIALISAIIVSFTGILTYIVSYAINLFAIIMFITFLIILLLRFVGVKFDDIAKQASDNKKVILIVLLVIFSIIFFKGFFGINNAFDISNPQNDTYNINTQANIGYNDVVPEENQYFWEDWKFDDDLVSAAIFLSIIGILVMFVG